MCMELRVCIYKDILSCVCTYFFHLFIIYLFTNHMYLKQMAVVMVVYIVRHLVELVTCVVVPSSASSSRQHEGDTDYNEYKDDTDAPHREKPHIVQRPMRNL